MARPRKNFVAVGERFGRLVVAGEISRSAVPVRCDCGREKSTNLYGLLNGKTKSCGCFNADIVRARAAAKPRAALAIIGKTFGRLTVLGSSQRGKHFVSCKCSCGS